MKQDDPTRTAKLVKLSDICGEFGVNFVFSTKIENDQVIQFVTQLDPLGGHVFTITKRSQSQNCQVHDVSPQKSPSSF